MTIRIFLIIFFLAFFNAKAQIYSSQKEKEIFELFKKDSINYNFIESLSIIDSTITKEEISNFKNKVDALILTFPDKETKDSKEKKRIKKIYDKIHDTFFKKYKNLAYFPEIISSGTYNCVTATALYTYIFDNADIPYHVKDTPSHVFLIAYPSTLKIQLETTAPGSYGFIAPKQDEINKTVQSLIEYKLITQEEVKEKGINNTYTDYFFGNEHIDKIALVGMQYFNKAIEDIENENYKNALSNIKKSLVFYDYPFSKYLYKQLQIQTINELELTSIENIEVLFDALLTISDNEDFGKKDLDYYIYSIVEEDDNSLEFIEAVANVVPKFNDEMYSNYIKENLYEYIAVNYADKSEVDEAIRIGEILFDLNSKNKKGIRVLDFSISKKLAMLPLDKTTLDTLFMYKEKFPFLVENKQIETLNASLYGNIAIQKFSEKNPIEGKEYVLKFEEIEKRNNGKLLLNSEAIAGLYLIAGRYHYGKNQYKEALFYFEKGLLKYPDHIDLKKMVNWAKEDSKN